MITSARPAQQERGSRTSSSTLPAVRHPTFAKHWLAGDKGGIELMTAAFGASAKQAPLRLAPTASREEQPTTHSPGQTHTLAPPPTRLRATLALLLLALAILFAEPAASLIGRL